MSNTLVRVYDNFAAAENARNALLGSGFPPASIHLTSNVDEATAVDGSFILDYKDTPSGPRGAYSQSLEDSDVNRQGRMKPDVMERGNHVLTVDADNEEELARASDITRQFGAIDMQERTDRPRSPS